MAGVIVIVVAVVIVVPVLTLVGGGLGAAVFGSFLKAEREAAHADSELVDLNV